MMIELMEETANMLRGVCMDPRVPQDTREALWSRVRKLDAATEAALDDLMPADQAMRYADLWAAGKMIGGDIDAVCLSLRAEVKRLQDLLFARGAMADAPCFCCGYNGPGYFQVEAHPCADRHLLSMREDA